MGRGVVILAIVIYIGITIACIVGAPAEKADGRSPGEADSSSAVHMPMIAQRAAELPFRGVAMQLQRIDWIDTEYRKSIDEIVDIGADTVMFVVDPKMENGSSSRIYLDSRFTPTSDQLGDLIDYAKGKKLRVVLMPIVLLDRPREATEWRGTIAPVDWTDWWQSYRAMLYHYSWIAEKHKADVLVVGSELVSTEKNIAEWHTTISMVRQTFKGLLTYSANWDHFEDIPFWEELDLIAMNSYWKLGENANVSMDELDANWSKIQSRVLGFGRRLHKPVIFTEVGWCSQANAAREPWDYTQDDVPIDLKLQKKLYEAFFKKWYGTKGFGGFMVWEWPPGDGGKDNRGYTPENKPAEETLREWFKKTKWSVE